MEYVCIRSNWNGERLFKEGRVYDLPEGENPKNFTPIDLEYPKREEAEFKCSECGKVVKTKLALSGHMRTHKK